MRAMSRYLSCVRPGVEFEAYFAKPKGFQAFLSDFTYCTFDVEFGAFYASVQVALFGFGFKLAVNDPLVLSIRLDAPCADVRLDAGLRFDWEKDVVLQEADDKRERFQKVVAASEAQGITIDAAEWESEDARKQRIRQVRRAFSTQFWKASPDDDIAIGNAVFLVFKEDGVYCEVRPENPQPVVEAMLDAIAQETSLRFDRPVNVVSADIRDDETDEPIVTITTGEVHAGEVDNDGRIITTPPCGVARHRDIGCSEGCANRR